MSSPGAPRSAQETLGNSRAGAPEGSGAGARAQELTQGAHAELRSWQKPWISIGNPMEILGNSMDILGTPREILWKS